MAARKKAQLEEQVLPQLSPARAAELLRQQADKIDKLVELRYDDPAVKAWNSFTEQVIIKAFGKPHENLDNFYRTRSIGSFTMGGGDRQFHVHHAKSIPKLKALLESYVEQIETFDMANEAVPVPAHVEGRLVPIQSNKVFIVHGRAEKPRDNLELILRRLGLDPIILHDQASQGLTLIEKLEKHGTDVGYAFILLTPDDVGAEASILDEKEIDMGKLQHRARQNVVFEFGIFVGLLGRSRVCCLYTGDIELPSDIKGLVYIEFNESFDDVQIKIERELRAAGYELGN